MDWGSGLHFDQPVQALEGIDNRTKVQEEAEECSGVAAAAFALSRTAPTGSFVPFTIILECSSGKGHAIQSDCVEFIGSTYSQFNFRLTKEFTMGKITTKGTGDYNDAIEKLLRKIEGNYDTHKSANTVGSLLLSAIRASSKDLMILPMASYLGQGAKQCRAIEEPKDKLKSAPKGIGGKDRTDRRDTWYLGGRDNPDTEFDERYTPLEQVAEGGGSDALMYFTPSEWGGGGSAWPGGGGCQ
jgi:hypothetical protein